MNPGKTSTTLHTKPKKHTQIKTLTRTQDRLDTQIRMWLRCDTINDVKYNSELQFIITQTVTTKGHNRTYKIEEIEKYT